MADTTDMIFQWDGETMRPMSRYHNKANAEFVVGEHYKMEVQEYRSWVSHKHQFAWLHEAWLSLPEHIAEKFANEDELRKFALIKGGFCDSATFVCSSKAEAQRFVAFLKSGDSEYRIYKVDGPTIYRFTAHSQSMRAMGKRRFQESKDAVLSYVAELLGVEKRELESAA
ncbi:hypothetical protein [Martelella limonii]|uniref:hypothetical protein n=1 Tax=Martelella limonii TaxID=1647649 RepID=UPI00158110B9|nr:hypothetical protein [Martelella limonii]